MSGFRLQSNPTAYQLYKLTRNGGNEYPLYLLRTEDGRLFGTQDNIGSYATTTFWLARTVWNQNNVQTFQFVGAKGNVTLACTLTTPDDEDNQLIVNDYAVYVLMPEGSRNGIFVYRSQFACRERYIVELETGESVLIGTELESDVLRAFWLNPVQHSRNKTVLAGGELTLNPCGQSLQFRLGRRFHTIGFEGNNPVVDGQRCFGVIRPSSFTSAYVNDVTGIGDISVEVTI